MHTHIRSLLSLVILTGCLAAAEPAAPNAAPPSVTEVAAKELAAQAAPVTSQATELAKTGNDLLRFMADRAKAYTGRLEDGVNKAIDVVQEQSPIIVAEFLRWRFWMHAIKAATPIVFGLMGIIMFAVGIRRANWDGMSPWCFVTIGGGLAVFVGVIGFFAGAGHESVSGLDHLMSCVQIKIAPRVYLLDQVSHLMGH